MVSALQQWQTPPQRLILSKEDVHVWRATLPQPPTVVNHLQNILSVEERARARRFYFEKDRKAFIVAHGLLRILLGSYLDCDPSLLRFQTNTYGKPALDLSQEPALHFNLSHSHELVLYAFTYSREIGIDIEYMRPAIAYEELARHSFSLHEQAALRSLPAEAQREGFFNCWTRKEAYIKARGMGLSLDLRLFDVSLKPGEPAALLQSRESKRETDRWSMLTLAPGTDYASALAVEGHDWRLSGFQYPLQ
jgi:4'-phosphopantetheinyl transferase